MTQQKIEFSLGEKAHIFIEEFTSKSGDSVFRLAWTDYVINEWAEFYPTLATALARVALLAQCLDESEAELFAEDSTSFTYTAKKFLSEGVI